MTMLPESPPVSSSIPSQNYKSKVPYYGGVMLISTLIGIAGLLGSIAGIAIVVVVLAGNKPSTSHEHFMDMYMLPYGSGLAIGGLLLCGVSEILFLLRVLVRK